ncbi:MAG: hypothetical protein ACREAN_00005, partial [Nitrosopumilaceae archaeon]
MVSKNVIITTGIIIIGLAVFWLLFLKPVSQQNEPFVGITSQIQNPYVQEFSLPPGSAPNGLIVDK